jgi:hypothetical protein
MSVEATSFPSAMTPVIRVRETAPQTASGPRAVQDRATLSEESKALAARLEASEKEHKLHLSPEELRELISPPESEPGR